jgi:hypothetical protein
MYHYRAPGPGVKVLEREDQNTVYSVGIMQFITFNSSIALTQN